MTAITLPSESTTLKQALASRGIGVGGSTHGWSRLKLPMLCWRLAKFSLVDRLRQRSGSLALDVGTLIHMALEWGYSRRVLPADIPAALREVVGDDEKFAEPILEALRVLGAPLAGQDGKPGNDTYLGHVMPKDLETWQILAVEKELDALLGEAHVSTKIDLVRKHPQLHGVIIVEHKSHRALTSDLVTGYGRDGQTLLQKYIWDRSDLGRIYGPVIYFQMNILVKTKVPRLERFDVVLEDADVARFAEATAPWAIDLNKRLASPGDYAWPENYGACKVAAGGGVCRYQPLCIDGDAAMGLYTNED